MSGSDNTVVDTDATNMASLPLGESTATRNGGGTATVKSEATDATAEGVYASTTYRERERSFVTYLRDTAVGAALFAILFGALTVIGSVGTAVGVAMSGIAIGAAVVLTLWYVTDHYRVNGHGNGHGHGNGNGEAEAD